MSKQSLPRIPDNLKSTIYDVINDFGCVRRRALIRYTCLIIRDSDYIKDEYKHRSVEIADQILQSLELNKKIKIARTSDEILVISITGSLDYTAMESFEAYVSINEELSDKGIKYWACHASTAGHPYDFVFGTPETIYRVVVFNTDALSKINYMSIAYKPDHDRDFTTLFIVTEAYMNEDFSKIELKGKYRLAFILPSGKDKICMLSEAPKQQKAELNDKLYI